MVQTAFPEDDEAVGLPTKTLPATTRAQSLGAAAQSDSSRAVAETQAAMVIAQRFPRDQVVAHDRIIQAFTRPSLAESAMYSYARGGTDITGPSIRAAETIAQAWGNMQFGIRELDQRPGESTVEAFAWDIETNTRATKIFQLPHIRHTKNGSKRLEDPRDIYELVANNGARRLRACILSLIPGDIVESAMNQADLTLRTKIQITPETIASLQAKFADLGVPKQALEARIQRRLDAITPALVVQLGKIYNSIKDGMSSPGEWFEIAPPSDDDTPADRAAQLKQRLRANGGAGPTADVAASQPAETPDDGPSPQELLDAQVAEILESAVDLDQAALAAMVTRLAVPRGIDDEPKLRAIYKDATGKPLLTKPNLEKIVRAILALPIVEAADEEGAE